MADDDEALHLNTLHRFAKHSPRMLLHEYSHCEVPAGCGGVVLRWLDPVQALPIQVDVTSGGSGRTHWWLDGEQARTGLAELRPGRHVLALEVNGDGLAAFPLAVVIRSMQGGVVLFSSQADGSWLATRQQPPTPWTRIDYPASDWRPLEHMPDPQLATVERLRWIWDRLPQGVQALRVHGPKTWVRFGFTLDAEQIRGLLGLGEGANP